MRIKKLTVELGSGEEMNFSIEQNGDVIALSCEVENDIVLSNYEKEKANAIAEFIFNSKF